MGTDAVLTLTLTLSGAKGKGKGKGKETQMITDVIARPEGPKQSLKGIASSALRFAQGLLATTSVLICVFSAHAVEIEPMRLEHSLGRGRAYSGSFKLKNSSHLSVDVFISTGGYRYIFSDGAIPPPQASKKALPSCEGWFQFEKTRLNLNPGGSAEAKFTIKVPRDAAEEHLCAILFDEKRTLQEVRPKEDAGGVQIQLTPRFSIPVYISIKENEKPSAKIGAISAGEDIQKDGLLINITLENTGTVHIRPFGTLLILNQKGEAVKNLPIGKSLPIFPGYKETLPVRCAKIPPGRYSAVATIEISEGNIIQKKTSFESNP